MLAGDDPPIPDDAAGARSVSKAHVRKALSALLKSDSFAGSGQLSDFLTFIVHRTLEGEADSIKAYTIAVDALGKGEDFDPQTNAAVRVAAGRLRQTLGLYNADLEQQVREGWRAKNRPVAIELKRGTYVPTFRYLDRADDAGHETVGRAADGPSLSDAHSGLKPMDPDTPLQTGSNLDGQNSAHRTATSAPQKPVGGASFTGAGDSGEHTVISQPLMNGDDLKMLEGALKESKRPSGTLAKLGARQTAVVAMVVGLVTAVMVAATTILDLDGRVATWLGWERPTEQTAAAPTTTNAPAEAASGELVFPAKVDVNLRPKVALTILFRDTQYPDWFKRGELEDSIVLAMTRFDDYQFIGSYSGTEFPLNDRREPDYHLLVTPYAREDLLRVFGRLIRHEDGVVLWSTQQRFAEPDPLALRNVPELAGRTYAPVGSPYGVIFADLLSSRVRRQKLACTLATYQYFNNKSDEGHMRARRCAEALRDAGSQLPSVYAALTSLYLDEYREGRNAEDPASDIVRRAEQAARQAVQYGPQSARAYQALFSVYRTAGKYDDARNAGRRALALNPYDTDVMGNYASWLISIGDYGPGRRMLDRMADLLDVHPTYVDVYRFLSYELEHNFDRADALVDLMDYSRSPMMAASVAMASDRRQKVERRKLALDFLRENDPPLLTDPYGRLRQRGFSENIARVLARKMKAADEADRIAAPMVAE